MGDEVGSELKSARNIRPSHLDAQFDDENMI